MINEILHGKINASWQENINFIRDKQEIYSKYHPTSDNSETTTNDLEVPKDFEIMNDILECLKLIILERSKKFIVHNIKLLRRHHPTPSQRIQNDMIQVAECFQFIVENNYSLALELRQAYSYTMRWYYKQYFARYIRSLTILQFKAIDTQYALGNGLTNIKIDENSNDKSNSTLFSSYLSPNYLYGLSTISNETISEYFQIKRRLSILSQEDNTVMISQIAENNRNKENYIEIGFKNLNLAILDNCSVEYNFLKSFFRVSDNVEELNGILEQIFQPTLDQAMEYTIHQLLQQTYDIFGVLISIRVANQLQFETERRNVPIISEYLNNQLILLWPRFQQLIDFQCENLRKISITQNMVKKNNNAILSKPHELTVQFGKFLSSLLMLAGKSAFQEGSDETMNDERAEPLYNSIIRMRNEFETVMTKCSKVTSSPERFLSLNYLYLYNILQKQHLAIQDDEAREEFDDTLDTSNDSNIKLDNTPLIFKETEDHFKILVEAYSKVT